VIPTEAESIERIKKAIKPPLNNEQLEAIKSINGPVLIIAGPGTGKTTTIIARAMYLLISKKAQPEEIILTTFTEKAAFEMRDRLNQLAEELKYTNDLHKLKVCTIHSLCNDFIKENLSYTHTRLKKGYTILDDLTQALFFHELFEEIIPKSENGKYLGKWRTKWYAIKNLIPYFNKITEELIDPSLLEVSDDEFLVELAFAYKEYQNRMFMQNKIDFAHLQKAFLDLLLENKELYQKIKGSTKYLMIDEYQDTNFIQEEILLTLAKPENNICVVGDEDQSLYRFRGATVRNILEFPDKDQFGKKCTKIILTINYRSHKEIISKYNKFMESIDWGKFRSPKEIKQNPKIKFSEYPAIFSIHGRDDKDEAGKVVDLIMFLKENKVISDYSDVAILLKSVRPNHSKHYIEKLKEHNIPYFSPRAKEFLNCDEIRLIIACFVRIFGYCVTVTDVKINSLKEYIENSLRALENLISSPLEDFIKEKASEIKNLKEGSLDLYILDYFYRLLAYKPFSDYLNERDRAHNLSIFSKLIKAFEEYYKTSIVTVSNKEKINHNLFESYLYFLLHGGIDEYEDPYNPIPKGYIQIMTFHQCKGLEFPIVIVGSLDKDFKIEKQIDQKLLKYSKRGQYESEDQIIKFDRMRHYYVAFSRAKELLVLTSSDEPKTWFTPILEYLDEYPQINKEALKEQRFKSKVQSGPNKIYSISNINDYEICPQQYLFYHEYEFELSKSAQFLFGSLIHLTIEDIHKEIHNGKTPSVEKIDSWFKDNYETLLLKGLRPIAQKYKESALKQIMSYFSQNVGDLLGRIYKTEFDVSVEKNDYIITGKIDLILKKNGKFEIFEFKTQHKPETNAESIIDRYFKQLCLYAYALKKQYNNNIAIEKLNIYWTAEERRKDALMQFDYENKDILPYFDSIVNRIKHKDFKVKTLQDTNKICEACDFRSYCSHNGII
jgi:DNA helicase-2/ATP-dependent DNA helicase PcrA